MTEQIHTKETQKDVEDEIAREDEMEIARTKAIKSAEILRNIIIEQDRANRKPWEAYQPTNKYLRSSEKIDWFENKLNADHNYFKMHKKWEKCEKVPDIKYVFCCIFTNV